MLAYCAHSWAVHHGSPDSADFMGGGADMLLQLAPAGAPDACDFCALCGLSKDLDTKRVEASS